MSPQILKKVVQRENDKPMVAQLRPWYDKSDGAKFLAKKQNDILLMNAGCCIKCCHWNWI